MANLAAGPFAAVNDVETAQGAPVSEALAQKYGVNNNDADARNTTNAAGVATNVTDIATNTAALAALKIPEVFDTTVGTGTIHTFSAAPTVVVVGIASQGASDGSTAVLTQSSTTARLRDASNNVIAITLSGTSLTTVGASEIYRGFGFV